jgi:L-amino acid N-acyltransferase YncA
MQFALRPFEPGDAADLLAIYAPIVRHTAISFEWEPPSQQEFRDRLARIADQGVCLVAVDDGVAVGYAYANRFRERRGYDWTTETTVYVHERARGQGVASLLMRRLLSECRARGRHLAIATIALPNAPSQALHRSLGFTAAGRFNGAGYKFDRSWDIEFWQLPLRSGGTPADPSA